MVFDSRDPTSGPIRLVLPETLPRFLIVYASGPSGSLVPRIRAWVEAHAGEPLRARVLRWLEAHPLEVTVHDKSQVTISGMGACIVNSFDPAAVRRMEAARACVLLRSETPLTELPVSLWAMIAAGRALSAAFNGAVLDPLLCCLWQSAPENQDMPADGSVAVSEHIRVLNSIGERGLAWFTTVGLTQFGLPNLEVRDAPPNLGGRLASLLCGLAQVLVEAVLVVARWRGAASRVLEISPEIRITSAHTSRALRSRDTGSPEKGGLVRLAYTGRGRGKLEPFIELRAPAGFEGNSGTWLNQVLDSISPEDPCIVRQEGTDLELERAHRKALAELSTVKARFQRGLPVGSKLQIKHGFIHEEGIEYMWIAVTTWKGNRIQGHLISKPVHCPDLRSGDPVEIGEVEVYDWLIGHEGGTWEGAYTDQVLEREL